MTEGLNTFCVGCGREAAWIGGDYTDRLHILGPQHPLVKGGFTVIGHHCRKCKEAATRKSKEVPNGQQ